MEEILEKLKAGLADHYEIQRELGEGGMAFVYLAKDLRHDRDVAIKVLKPELAASLGAERFLREIRITAKLSHPHILPLYDSGETEGLLYYVMPFIMGESLADYIKREKQLALEEAIQITREVAEALGHAHTFGLVHRDIKPDNVMMSGGHAIVADFGISRAVSESGGERLTQTGMSVGTPAYMSPEQAAGDPDVDGRADIYSLGCMFYEMLVGDIPFTGPTPQAIMARHTMDQITPPSIMRESIPDELEDIVVCAMAKVPADRFRTAMEMVEALKAVESGGTPKIRKTATRITGVREAKRKRGPSKALLAGVGGTAVVLAGLGGWFLFGGGGTSTAAADVGLDPSAVAVLYFEDLSSDGELSYVADGFTEGLIDKLSEVRGLTVISRNGVAQFRDPELSRDSIANLLEVGSLVTGTVEPVGERIRVTLRLVDGNSGADLERTSFELPQTELLAAQDSVAESASRFLRQRLGEEVRLRAQRTGTSSVEAWSLLQQGERLRKEGREIRDDDPEAAMAILERGDSVAALAQQADPDWLEPVLLRGWIALDMGLAEGGVEAVPFIEEGKAFAEQALATDPNDPRAHELRGVLRYRHWELRVTPDQDEWEALLAGAQADLEQAVRADPSLANAQLTLSQLYYHVDDVPAALMAARDALQEDAYLDAADRAMDRLFWGSIDLEQFSQARRWCAEGARRFPEDLRFVRCQLWLLASPAEPADVDRAWELHAKMDSVVPDALRERIMAETEILIGGVLGRAEMPDSARAMFQQARSRITHEVDPDQFLLTVEAYARSLVGDLDEAIDLLKQYKAANPDHNYAEDEFITWWWRDIRAHPRFSEVSGTAD